VSRPPLAAPGTVSRGEDVPRPPGASEGFDLADDRLPRGAAWALRMTLFLLAVYIVLDILAQLLPPHYSAIAQAESDLAVGPFGYVMAANFVVRGVLTLAFLFGISAATLLVRRSPFGVALLGIWALGAFVLAAFPTDVGTAGPTLHGTVHLVTAAVAFLCVAVGEVLLSVQFSDEPRLASLRVPALLVSGLAVVTLLALLYVQGRPRLAAEVFGLVERVFLALALLWILLVSVTLLRSQRRRIPAPVGG
jgi:hypothetical protein